VKVQKKKKETNKIDMESKARQFSLQWVLDGGWTAGYKYTDCSNCKYG